MKKNVFLMLAVATMSQAEEAKEGPVIAATPAIPGSEIYLFDINNKGEIPELLNGKNITHSAGYDSQPRFGKKGKMIYYTKFRNGQTDIYQYDIKKDLNQAYMVTPESEYSPTPIPGKKGLSVIQVDAQGDQYLVKLNNKKDQQAERHSDLKPVGYHNWVQNDGLHLWTFVLNTTGGGDLYHQGKNKKVTKIEENIGRSFITDKNHTALYYVDKKTKPWQIKTRKSKKGKATKVMDLIAGSEDFTLDSKGRFWTGQGQNLFVSTNKKHWTLIKQFTDPKQGDISRITTNPKGNQIAVVMQEATGENTTE
ncbi:TolB family protein [Marinicella rhabdoformis]|uniref:TolB family protein n=1 Tax=Marinicella rhabdoformis TaxID=2580566 RepID=UPI0012AEC040|nr:PD40 domain-containing protein [Marinicella rhabdoformis]